MTLFAQSEMSGWATLVSAVANVGFAVFAAAWMMTKSGPQQSKDFLAAEKEQRDTFGGMLREQQEVFTQTLKDQRDSFKEAEEKRQDKYEKGLAMIHKYYEGQYRASREEHKESLRAVIEHCQVESERRDEAMKVSNDTVTATTADVREVLEQVRDMLIRMDRSQVKG